MLIYQVVLLQNCLFLTEVKLENYRLKKSVRRKCIKVSLKQENQLLLWDCPKEESEVIS